MKYQYKILNDEYDDTGEEAFNKLGKKGWELVSVVYQTWTNERKGYKESQTIYYFKKQLK